MTNPRTYPTSSRFQSGFVGDESSSQHLPFVCISVSETGYRQTSQTASSSRGYSGLKHVAEGALDALVYKINQWINRGGVIRLHPKTCSYSTAKRLTSCSLNLARPDLYSQLSHRPVWLALSMRRTRFAPCPKVVASFHLYRKDATAMSNFGRSVILMRQVS